MYENNFSASIPEHVIREIKDISPDTLAAHHVIYEARKTVAGKPTYVCPNCDNGTGRDGTGILPNSKNGVWVYHCFRCDETFDNIHLLALYYNLHPRSDFQEICRLACNEFNIYLESNYQSKKVKKLLDKVGGHPPKKWTKPVDIHLVHPPKKSPEVLANEKKNWI